MKRIVLLLVLLMVIFPLIAGCTSTPSSSQQGPSGGAGSSSPPGPQSETGKWTRQGYDFLNTRQFQQAIEAFDSAISADPTNVNAWDGKGNALFNLKKSDEAMAAFDKTISLDPGIAPAWVGKGNVFLKLKKTSEATAAFEKAISFDPNNPHAWQGKGEVLLAAGKPQEALEAFNKALSIDPNYKPAQEGKDRALNPSGGTQGNDDTRRGFGLIDQGKNDEALGAFDAAISSDPTNVDAWNGKGNALFNLKKNDEAMAAFDKAISINANYPHAYVGKGNVLFKLGKNNEAMAAFDNAISLDPNLSPAWNGKGNVLVTLGKISDAIEAFNKALSIDPNNKGAQEGKDRALNPESGGRSNDASTNKGFELLDQGMNKEALQEFETALALDLNNSYAWQGKGTALNRLRYRDGEALTCFERSLAINPDNAYAWTGKGQSLYGLEKYQESITALEQALSIDETDAVSWTTKGMSLVRLGRCEEAKTAFRKAISIKPHPPMAEQGMINADNPDFCKLMETPLPGIIGSPGFVTVNKNYSARMAYTSSLKQPLNIAVAPDGTIYIRLQDNSVVLIDPGSGNVIKTTYLDPKDPVIQKHFSFSLTNSEIDRAISQKGIEYESRFSDGTIVKRGQDGSQTKIVTGLSPEPIHIDFGPDGNLYFSDRVYTFAKVDPEGGAVQPVEFIRKLQSETFSLKDFGFEPKGTVLFLNPTTGSVVRVSLENQSVQIVVPSTLNSPVLAISTDRKIFAGRVADYPLEVSKIVQVENGAITRTVATVPGQLKAIAFGKDGTLYGTSYALAPDRQSDEFWLYKINNDGTLQTLVNEKNGPQVPCLYTLSVDPVSGDFIGFDTKSNRVAKFPAGGGKETLIGPVMSYPVWTGRALVDSDGAIWLLVIPTEGELHGPSVPRELYYISPTGESKRIATLPVNGCCTMETMAIGPDHAAYIILGPEFILVRVQSNGTIEQIAQNLPVDPLGITVDGNGRIVFTSQVGIHELIPQTS